MGHTFRSSLRDEKQKCWFTRDWEKGWGSWAENLQDTENFFGVGSTACDQHRLYASLYLENLPRPGHPPVLRPPCFPSFNLPGRVLLNKYLSLLVGGTRPCCANRKVLFRSTSSQRENPMNCSALRYQLRQPSNRLLSKQNTTAWPPEEEEEVGRGEKQRPRSTMHMPMASYAAVDSFLRFRFSMIIRFR